MNKPMLAGTLLDESELNYPVYVSPKIDGIRCLGVAGRAMSRAGKPFRNKALQALFADGKYDGLDGELIFGPLFSSTVFRDTTSVVMSHDKTIDDLRFYVFDKYSMSGPFSQRFSSLNFDDDFIRCLEHLEVETLEELSEYEADVLAKGAEGVMIRDPNGAYKHGRSTVKEGGLLKLKRFSDAEYKVVGFEERMHNANEAEKDAFGRTKRSTHQDNMIGRGDLGSLICELEPGVTFNVGSGFDDATREEIWNNKESYLGRYVTVKSFLIGVKDLPRFPIFKGFRDPVELE